MAVIGNFCVFVSMLVKMIANNDLGCYREPVFVYERFHLIVQNAVSVQPCVGKLGKSHVLLNILGCNCG